MSDGARSSVGRIIGLILMVAAVVWIVFNILFTLGLGIAWVAETGLTEDLQPWLVVLFVTGAISAGLGYGVLFVGRWIRDRA